MKKTNLALFLALASCDQPFERPQEDPKWDLNYQMCSEAFDERNKFRTKVNYVLDNCLSSFSDRKISCPDKNKDNCHFTD